MNNMAYPSILMKVQLTKDKTLRFHPAWGRLPALTHKVHKTLGAKSLTLEVCGRSPALSASGQASPHLTDLSAYIQEEQQQQELDSKLMEVSLRSSMQITLRFVGHFVESLCRVLPSPFLLFLGRVRNIDARGHRAEVEFEKRYQLEDILPLVEMDSPGELTSQTFQPPDSVYCREGKLVFRLAVGWEEPAKHGLSMGPKGLGQNLFENELTKDFTLVAGNGVEIKCHKIILAAQSSVLTSMLSPSTGMQESELGRVELKENSEDGIRLLLRYLYGLELVPDDLTCDLMVELFQTAHKYDLDRMERFIYAELLLRKDVNWFTPQVILELYFYARNVNEFRELTNHSLSIMTGMNIDNLRNCEGFKKLGSDTQVDLLCEVIKLTQKKVEGIRQLDLTSESGTDTDTDDDDEN